MVGVFFHEKSNKNFFCQKFINHETKNIFFQFLLVSIGFSVLLMFFPWFLLILLFPAYINLLLINTRYYARYYENSAHEEILRVIVQVKQQLRTENNNRLSKIIHAVLILFYIQ